MVFKRRTGSQRQCRRLGLVLARRRRRRHCVQFVNRAGDGLVAQPATRHDSVQLWGVGAADVKGSGKCVHGGQEMRVSYQTEVEPSR